MLAVPRSLRPPQFALLFIAISVALSSCNITRHVPEGQYLLVKNKVEIDNKKIDTDELYGIIKQKPNRKILGLIRFHLGVYNYANTKKEKDSKFREWLKNTIGEPPVVLDSSLTVKSSKQLQQYLFNTGYFNGTVTGTTIRKRKKARVIYTLKPGQPYIVRQVAFALADTSLLRPIRKSVGTLIRPGHNYEVDVFEKERERVSRSMRNQGYYYFNKEYIRFDVDSTLGRHKVDALVKVLNPYERATIDGQDTLLEKKHQVYFINNIYINSDYNARKNSVITDTVYNMGYYFLNPDQMQHKQSVLAKSIFFKKGELYRLENVEYSQNHLAALRTFRFINIEFKPAKEGNNKLDCFINLSRLPRQSATLETEGTNRSGNLGIAGSVTYQNKNTFRGAQILEAKVKGGLEAQRLANSSNENQDAEVIENFTPFNTLEFGGELSLYVPNLLLSQQLEAFKKLSSPKTKVNLAYNFQNRPDYKRNLASASYSFSFEGEKYGSLSIFPAEISVIQIDKQPAFEEQLSNTRNNLLISSYNNHFISASKISYSFSTQNINKLKNFFYYRANLEGAGNMLRAAHSLAGAPLDSTDSYEIFGIRFAQYVKTDITFIKYNILNRRSKFVWRAVTGIGIPLNNLGVLPFEKSFFGGGANGIRAWQARTLGPGSLSDTTSLSVDQVGDVQLELNLEYRFKITQVVEGALFSDFGNIWLLEKDPQRTGGEFQIDRFYKEIAMSPGVGVRLTFSFFTLRFDTGLQALDPSLPAGEQWIFQPKDKTNDARKEANTYRESLGLNKLDTYRTKFNFNLGIGYPF